MKHTIDEFSEAMRQFMTLSGLVVSKSYMESLSSLYEDPISMNVFIALSKYSKAFPSVKSSYLHTVIKSINSGSMHDRHAILRAKIWNTITAGYSMNSDNDRINDDEYVLSLVPLAVDTLIEAKYRNLVVNSYDDFKSVASVIPSLLTLDMHPDDAPDMKALILGGLPITKAIPVWKDIADMILDTSTDADTASTLVSMIEIKRSDGNRADEMRPMDAVFHAIIDGYQPSQEEYYVAAHQFITGLVDNNKTITEDSKMPLSLDIYGSPHIAVALLRTYDIMKHRILNKASAQTYHMFYENSVTSPLLYSMLNNHSMICLSVAEMMANIHHSDSITVGWDADFILESLMMGTVSADFQ